MSSPSGGQKKLKGVPAGEKRRIFVSHRHEEAALGKALRDGLEDACSGRIAVFVSSDPRVNPGGEPWLPRIGRELKDTQILLPLISPYSLGEPWLWLELGAAWALRLAVFPLCHSGQKLASLPRPLQDFGGTDLLEHDDAIDRLFGVVEREGELQIPTKWPRKEFLADLRRAAASLET